MQVKTGLLIGELSQRVHLPTPTIRYYERLGLLDPPQRTQSRYRYYSQDAIEKLQFIQKAKCFGLSLDEIKQLIAISTTGQAPCTHLKEMVKQHLDKLDHHIREVMTFRQELASRYEKIDAFLATSTPDRPEQTGKRKICSLIEQEVK